MQEVMELERAVDFVHLHVHTGYSLLDGAAKIKNLIAQVKRLGMNSVAITDHGVMYGAIDFYKEAKAQGIKPIIGCEVYVAKRRRTQKEPKLDTEYYHLVLLAQNMTGYKNLIHLVSKGFLDGYYYKPRIDLELLREHAEGLIGLSACLGGVIPKTLRTYGYEKAKEAALLYEGILGKGNFYLEIQDHGIDEQKITNQELMKMSEETGIPLVATNDTHYIAAEDVESHDILLCIQTGRKVHEEDRIRYEGGQFFIKSPEEMAEIFSYVPEALENTLKIAERCNLELTFHEYKLPKYDVPEGYTAQEYLRKQCYAGLQSRYQEMPKSYQERLEYELNMIETMGFVDYFLVVWDFIKYAKDHGIMVGPGRGSAAGSIVSYCLGITNIDPMKYNLLFERFLNPERVSMPDIDIDFCYERRQEVIDYVIGKYGEEKVAQIITFGTMSARAVIRDVGRALDIPYGDVDRIAKMIPMELGINIDRALEINAELNSLYEKDEQVKYLIKMARALEGLPRHASTHAAGVVIAKDPLIDVVPLQRNEEVITTQYTMTTLEELGLLKMDFLGLRTLTVVQNALRLIKRNHGIEIDIDGIGFEDAKVYGMIGEGKTEGVFQLESAGMKQFMKELKPDSLEEVIAGISLYRPGPMDFIPKYIKGKNEAESVEYITEELEPILSTTYGCIVYQEQVMQIVQELGGYNLGRSDLVRRAMSKKKADVMEKERKNFIYGITDDTGNIVVPGCVRNNISPEKAAKIFDEMTDFARYAFNKSHAAAYAVVSYWTAWLKYYYPVEFMAALMTSVMDHTTKIAEYIFTSRNMGIEILPPDVNESIDVFSVSKGMIRFGMAAIKNVGRNAIHSIVEEREQNGKFQSFTDFCERVDARDLNKRAVESLIKCGAFDSLGLKRSQLLASFERILEGVAHARKNNIAGQFSLFDLQAEAKQEILVRKDELLEIPEFKQEELLKMEKEMLGVYISGHPLLEYEDQLRQRTTCNSYDLMKMKDSDEMADETHLKDGDMVIMGGIINAVKIKTTKNNKMMAFVTLEDLLGTTEIIVFPNQYALYKNYLQEDQVIYAQGRISAREEEEAKILCENIQPMLSKKQKKLYLKIGKDMNVNDIWGRLKPILSFFHGNIPVYVYFEAKEKLSVAPREYWVNIEQVLLKEVQEILGEEGVKVTGE